MDISDIIALIGLLLLTGIFVLLRKREKHGHQDSEKLTVRQMIPIIVFSGALVVLAIMNLPDIWTWLFSLLFGGGSSSIS